MIRAPRRASTALGACPRGGGRVPSARPPRPRSGTRLQVLHHRSPPYARRAGGRPAPDAAGRGAGAADRRRLVLSAHVRATGAGGGSSAKKTGWANLPVNLVVRNGMRVKDMSSKQVAKLDALLKTVLSPQGYASRPLSARPTRSSRSSSPAGPEAPTISSTARGCITTPLWDPRDNRP